MANKIPQLDPGFDEVHLDDGFEEVPVNQPKTVGSVLSQKLSPDSSGMEEKLKNSFETLSDANKAYVKSLLFGGAEEAGAGIQTGLEKAQSLGHELLPSVVPESSTQVSQRLTEQGATGDVGPTTSGQFYDKAQQEENKRYKESEERSPYASGAANLGGLVSQGILTGALTPLGSGAKVAAAAQEIAPGALEAASAIPGAKLVGKGIASGIELAPLGAVQGALESEQGKLVNATPEEQQKLTADALGGAATAGVFGAGLDIGGHLLGKAAGGVSNWWKGYKADSPKVRQLGKAFEEGKEGLSYSSEGQIVGELAGQAREAGNTLVDKMNQGKEFLGQAVGKSIDDATTQGVRINIDSNLKTAAQELENAFMKNPSIDMNPQSQKVFQKMLSSKDSLTPDELRSLRDDMDNMYSLLEGDTNPTSRTTKNIIAKFRKGINTSLKDAIPAYKQSAERYEQYLDLFPETLLRKGQRSDISGVRLSELSNADEKLSNAATDLLEGASRPGVSTDEAKETYNALQSTLSKLDQSETARAAEAQAKGVPFESVFDKMGLNKDQIINYVKNTSDKISSAQLARGGKPMGTLAPSVTGTIAKTLAGTGEALTGFQYSLANKAGIGVNKVSNIGSAMYSMTPERLTGLAQKLKDAPHSTYLGQALENALVNKDNAAKNAAVFAILQNPNARLLISGEDIGNIDEQPNK